MSPFLSLFGLALLPNAALAAVSTVTLPYGKVQGISNYAESAGVALARPVTAFFSIPYASASRFRYACPPVPLNGTLNLSDYGPVCPQANGTTFPLSQQSEECLSLSVFIPEGTKPNEALPVVVWVPGGAFNSGGGRSLNMPSMVGNSPPNTKFIGVSINYRLGALGFIPSKLTKEAKVLNIGFDDITKSLEWVQCNIAQFGGSKDKVTLFGESAGAHAVGFQFLSTQKKLFRAVIMDSGGPTSRSYPKFDFPLYETQAKEFFVAAGCNLGNFASTFACLRGLPLETIRNSSVELFNKYNPSIQWPFQPAIDGSFIRQAGSLSFLRGMFNRIPVLTGYNTDEGTGFVPATMETNDEFRAFFKTLLGVEDCILDKIEALYPEPTAPGSPYANSIVSTQFARVSAAYGDYAYISAVQDNAFSISNFVSSILGNGQVFKYHFNGNVSESGMPAKFGVFHSSELAFLSKTSKKALATIMNAHYASFICTGGDPNKLMPAGSTWWPAFTKWNQVQLRFKGEDTTVAEKDDFRREQLEFWRSIPKLLNH